MDQNFATITEQAAETLSKVAVTYGLSVIGALIILIVGFWAAGRARKLVERLLGRMHGVDPMLGRFLGNVTRYIIIIVTVLAVLSEFGVQTASLLAVLGTAGLAIGLALQGTLSNVAAGVMLLFLRPFKTGDYIEAGGVSGTVEGISLFNTELATPDNVQIFAPNSDVWSSAIKNYSSKPTRRVEIACGISYDDDIGKAMDVMRKVVAEDERVLPTPEPVFAVKSLGDSSVNVICRVWVKSADFWPFTFDKTREVKEGYDAAGLTIPFPSRTVYHVGDNAADCDYSAVMEEKRAKFRIGQVVKHRLFPFRGVIFDVDPVFNNTEEWWLAIPEHMRPHKDQPFYHLLAENDETEYEAYVSEQNLLIDDSGKPVRHPQVKEMFGELKDGLYEIPAGSAH